jgi:type VI secretion system protein ImpE
MSVFNRQSPEKVIEELVASVRAEPQHATHRWSLFQCFCITGEWQRALQQLQVYGQLDQSAERVVQTYRDLVRAERWRESVMTGNRQPAFVYDDVPDWMRALLAAISSEAQGHAEAADHKREAALDIAPLVSGRSEQHIFEWLGDSDSRLGPVCEFIAAGSYRWVSLSDISAWRIQRPTSWIDLVWSPCMLTLNDGAVLHGFMPTRYPLPRGQRNKEDDALLLGQKTVWQAEGKTGVIGFGRKTWSSSAGDIGIFELNDCRFGAAEIQSGYDAKDQAAEDIAQ